MRKSVAALLLVVGLTVAVLALLAWTATGDAVARATNQTVFGRLPNRFHIGGRDYARGPRHCIPPEPRPGYTVVLMPRLLPIGRRFRAVRLPSFDPEIAYGYRVERSPGCFVPYDLLGSP